MVSIYNFLKRSVLGAKGRTNPIYLEVHGQL